jgi:hypothetical protein
MNAIFVEMDADMGLAERDTALIKIESQIEAKRKMLMEKRKSLEKVSKENELLKLVLKDYNKYYNAIKREKEKQFNAMNLLNDYVGDIIKSGKFTEADIMRAKEDQQLILDELKHIRKDLDEVII